MNDDIIAKLPTDLFSYARLPERDDDGLVCHPDIDLIHELVGVDDEGEATSKFIEALGYKSSHVQMEIDAPDLADRYFEEESTDCSQWTPSKPDGEGWLLVCIVDTEDGPVACYVRKGEE